MSSRRLGRGLDALIQKPPAAGEEPSPGVVQIDPREVLANPCQPRKRFALNELEELKASISKEGMLQPLVVRKRGERYELIAGERRLRVAKDLGLAAVPAMVMDVPDDRLLEIALIENIHREDLNPIELAEAFRDLMRLKGWTQEALAGHLSLSRPGVTNTIRLLDLPQDIQTAIARGQITMGHAKVLLSVADPKEQRLLFEKIAEERLSVRDLEAARSEVGPPEPSGARPVRKAARKSPNIASLEEELSGALGTRVTIRQGKVKGVVGIEFYTPDDFERIRKAILAARVTS